MDPAKVSLNLRIVYVDGLPYQLTDLELLSGAVEYMGHPYNDDRRIVLMLATPAEILQAGAGADSFGISPETFAVMVAKAERLITIRNYPTENQDQCPSSPLNGTSSA